MKRRFRHRYAARLLRSAATIFFLCASASLAAEPATVRWEADRLTVKAKDAELREVLREIGEKTGTPMEGLEHVDGKVSVDIEKANLAEGLRKVLGQRAHAWSTLNKRPPGKSGFELQFPAPAKATGDKPVSPPPSNTPSLVEESWYGPDGKPKFDVKRSEQTQ